MWQFDTKVADVYCVSVSTLLSYRLASVHLCRTRLSGLCHFALAQPLTDLDQSSAEP